jgi:hypothetical protein
MKKKKKKKNIRGIQRDRHLIERKRNEREKNEQLEARFPAAVRDECQTSSELQTDAIPLWLKRE